MAERIVHIFQLPFGARITISEDLDQAIAKTRLLRDRLAAPQPVYKGFLRILRLDARRQFAQGGDPAWKALALSTVAQKKSQGQPALTKKGRVPWRLKQNGEFAATNILIRTGALRDSWSVKNNKEHIETCDEQKGEIVFGSKNRVARWMQNGTRPYTISPKKSGGSLRFMGSDGKSVFAKLVKHPGLPARPVRITSDAKKQMVKLTEDYFSGEVNSDGE